MKGFGNRANNEESVFQNCGKHDDITKVVI